MSDDTPRTSTEDELRRHGGYSGPADEWSVIRGYENALGRWVDVADETRRTMARVMAPDPDDLDAGPPAVSTPAVPSEDRGRPGTPPPDEPTWGLAVQVYAARSTDSWGIGDLVDLRTVGAWAAARGAGCMLITPIDAVAPVTPRETSPYTPTTRRFLDPIYLRVEEVPGADRVDLVDVAERARARNADRTIDRDAVWADKQEALRRIWDEVPAVRDDPAFAAFRDERGDSLRHFTAYLVAVPRHRDHKKDWPEEVARPDTPAAEALADSEEAAFHAWQQYCLDLQLAAADEVLPLLRDLPIGFDPAGFDAWEWRGLLAEDVTVGAPPDELAPQGQDWSLPAFVPWKLAQAGFAPLHETYRAAMRNAGGLRIDHVLGLFRLYWIPGDGAPADGAYIRQDVDAQLDVVAAASRDRGAWVVGEDLGTVERGVRPQLHDRNMLRYLVLWFEPDPPARWEELALASLSTHDLPTVAGMWTGGDADVQRGAGLEPDVAWLDELRDRLAGWAGISPDAPVEDALVALHALVAAGPSRVVLGQLDDLLGVVERPNVPGTDRHQRPANWSLALPHPVDRLDEHPLAGRVADALRRG